MPAARTVAIVLALVLASGCSLVVDPLVSDPAVEGADGSGATDSDSDSDSDENAGSVTGLRVFVTNDSWNGNLSGLGATGPEAADQRCLLAAAEAGLNGRFLAWLSDDVRAEQRLPDVGPWLLVGTGDMVFANLEQLAIGPSQAIDRNEYGFRMAPASVWTGTPAAEDAPVPDERCNRWKGTTTIVPNGDRVYQALTGRTSARDASWTEAAFADCTMQAHLYCFEYSP